MSFSPSEISSRNKHITEVVGLVFAYIIIITSFLMIIVAFVSFIWAAVKNRRNLKELRHPLVAKQQQQQQQQRTQKRNKNLFFFN